MTLKSRIAKLENTLPRTDTVHFMGWKDCEWRYAEGLIRGETESKDAFFDRVKAITDKKFIWCE